jgi:predicted KAP-like P-loop ATPase
MFATAKGTFPTVEERLQRPRERLQRIDTCGPIRAIANIVTIVLFFLVGKKFSY